MQRERFGFFRSTKTRAQEPEPALLPPAPTPAEDPYAIWSRVSSALRRNDAGAYASFTAHYAGGARILLRRRAGSVRAERMLDDALAGAASEIRLGWIRTPRDLVFFLRDLCEQSQLQPGASLDTPAELSRTRVPAAHLETVLARLSEAERLAVRLYFLQGRSLAESIAQAKLSRPDADRLRIRLRLAFRQAGPARDSETSSFAGPALHRAAASGR